MFTDALPVLIGGKKGAVQTREKKV